MSADLMSIIPFLIPVMLIQLVLFIIALLKWVKKKKLSNRIVWLLVIIFVNLFGPIIFLVLHSGARSYKIIFNYAISVFYKAYFSEYIYL